MCSALPSGNGEKASTELGFLALVALTVKSGYRPSILVLRTVRATRPIPLVAKWENAIPLSSAETRAVCRVPRKPRCNIAASAVCPSASGLRRRSIGEICRKGFAGFPSSQVKMFPDAWPPAIVERSAEMLIEVTEPLSTATGNEISGSSRVLIP